MRHVRSTYIVVDGEAFAEQTSGLGDRRRQDPLSAGAPGPHLTGFNAPRRDYTARLLCPGNGLAFANRRLRVNSCC